MTRNEPPERREVFYRGHVQGVGFRYSTRQIARDFEIAGFVENLPDGRVHLVIEAPGPEIEAFLNHLRDAMSHYIHGTQMNSGPASGEFTGFTIRH